MLEFLLGLPALVRVGCMFAAILLLNWAGLPLGAAIVVSAAGLSLWTGAGLAAFHYLASSLLAAENVLLLIVILLLLFFTESLTVSGRIEQTIASLRARLRRPHVLLAGLPALIGLLPMPGGALVSAPLVASVDISEELGRAHKSAINYWFRHIWEPWWPLYPGVVLAIKYSRLPMTTFYAIEMPLSIACIAAGIWFILRRVRMDGAPGPADPTKKPASTAPALAPIGALVLVSLVGSALLGYAGIARTTANLLAMLIGLVVALVPVFVNSPSTLRKAWPMLLSQKTWSLMLVLVGVLMFSAALKAPLDKSGATFASHMGADLMSLGIPIVAVMMALPFIAGFVTGIAVGFVGISFPLVFGLVAENAGFNVLASTTVLAYVSGYVGMMLSPIHICFVVSNEYFETRTFGVYRYTLLPSIVVLLAGAALAFVYRMMF